MTNFLAASIEGQAACLLAITKMVRPMGNRATLYYSYPQLRAGFNVTTAFVRQGISILAGLVLLSTLVACVWDEQPTHIYDVDLSSWSFAKAYSDTINTAFAQHWDTWFRPGHMITLLILPSASTDDLAGTLNSAEDNEDKAVLNVGSWLCSCRLGTVIFATPPFVVMHSWVNLDYGLFDNMSQYKMTYCDHNSQFNTSAQG
ncbi:uncharacterized protein HD556DRAFT_1309619 [Suillus plorans]|uniref:Uncharacterized protein n=1 Tax=Suillus plorans TaxID=116603 RepID=A0A9P7ALV0_9AGAM|nr:uncharacterized protein HD556DRAFT_1309619 [Suillus plorans]KAG1792076.1 hypothetical protein HD556DRAFT_1309619 [Suillus plorans]